VHKNEYERALEISRKVAEELQAKGVRAATDIAKVSVVGVGMRSHAGIASKMFRALAAERYQQSA